MVRPYLQAMVWYNANIWENVQRTFMPFCHPILCWKSNLAKLRTWCTKSTSAPLAITGLLCLTYYFSDVARLASQQSSKFSSVVIWFSVECRVDSKWNQSAAPLWLYQPFMPYLTCNKGSVLHWGCQSTRIHTRPLRRNPTAEEKCMISAVH